MGLVKTSITISEDIFKQAKSLSNNFSALVAEALNEYIRKKNTERAIESFGKWKEREKDSVNIVNEMRMENSRDYADSDN